MRQRSHRRGNTSPGPSLRVPRDKFLLGVFFAAIALSAALRFWGLAQKSFWLDEGASAVLVGREWRDMVPRIITWEKHPPLYFILLKSWSWVFGAGDFSLRAFSALASLGMVFFSYRIARKLSCRLAGLAAAFLVATSAYQIFFAQEVRQYALTGLFFAASTWFLVSGCVGQKPRLRDWVGYVLCNLAALYTFYYAVFGIAAQQVGFWAAILLVRRHECSEVSPSSRGPVLRRAALGWLVANAALAGAAFPLVPIGLRQLTVAQKAAEGAAGAGISGWTIPATFREFVSGFFLPYYASDAAQWAWQIFYMLLAVSPLLLGLVWAFGRPARAALLYALLLVPFACLWLFPFKVFDFQSKHLFFLSIFPFVILGASISNVRTRLPGMVLAGAVFLTNVVSLGIYYQPSFQKEDWRAVSSHIRERYRPGDAVYLNPAYIIYPFGRYWDSSLASPAYHTAEGPHEEFWREILKASNRLWLIEASNPMIGPDPVTTRWFMESMDLVTMEKWSFFFTKVKVSLLSKKTVGAKQGEDHRGGSRQDGN